MDLTDVGECRVRLENGQVVIERADRNVWVSDHVLENLDARYAHFGDGILTIHGREGDVSYGLSYYDPYLRRQLGTRSA